MKNSGSTLDSILKKAASFSEQINKVRSLSNQLNGEKASLVEKEASLESDLFALVNSLHDFQQETISTLSDLYAKMQGEAEAAKIPPPEPPDEVEFEVKPKPEEKKEPEPEPSDEIEIEVKPKKEAKEKAPVKKVEKALKEEEKKKKQKEDEEVFLFDL